MIVLDGRQTPDAGSNVHADPVRIILGHFQPCVIRRHPARADGVLDERIHFFNVFFFDELRGIKAFDFARDLGGITGWIKPGDPTDAGLTVTQRLPCLLDPHPRGSGAPASP